MLAEGSRLRPPKSPQVDNYLMRMDVMRLLGVDVGEKFARRTLVRFRPCRNFQEANYGAVAGEMATALAESCIADEVARASVRICLDELAENVPHHADAAAGGFAAAQGWPKRGKFEVGIVDLGIGVASSLRKNPDYAELRDDARAVRVALGQGVTSNPDRNAGIGLFITKRLLRANGGMPVLRSGFGSVTAGAVEEAQLSDVHLPGTLVALRARTDHPLDINEVYRSIYADDEDEYGPQAS